MVTSKYTADKVEVDEKQVMKRCNRLLSKDGHRICKTRGPRDGVGLTDKQRALGRFYVIGKKRVVEKHVDLEEFARRNGIIAPYEVLVRD